MKYLIIFLSVMFVLIMGLAIAMGAHGEQLTTLAGILGGLALAIFVIVLILQALFMGVAKVGGAVGGKVGGAVAEAGTITKALITEDYTDIDKKRKKNKKIGKNIGKSIGSATGLIGAAALGADVFDGVDSDVDDTGDMSSAQPLSSGNEVDLDNDGIIDGFDTDGDGTLDTNIDGVPITGLEDVKGYTKEDGSYVEGYKRTIKDDSTSNNLRPPNKS